MIEALILNKLRVDAEKQIGPFSKAVITVPAYFDEVRRKATQDSGYMAGFEVLDIINEPTAAAVAFGFQQGYLDTEGGTAEPQNILVYDLGGGTFDVTVMEIRGTEFNALATDGDVRLGGYDWDQRLVDLVAENFIRRHQTSIRARTRSSAGKLWRECEDAKRTLSARQKAAVACDHPRRLRADRDRPAAVRGGHAGPVGPHAVHHGPSLAGGGAGLEGARPRVVGGRFDPHADGPRHAPPAFRQGARRLGGRRRSGCPRGRFARLADPGPAGGSAADRSRSGTSTRTAWAWWASTR